jgi:hypothetical protein
MSVQTAMTKYVYISGIVALGIAKVQELLTDE